ncbi:MAG: YolD-like family protein [Bacilli bacterium]|nr:YolD-like family protein [Bacilli bacterium]
MNDRGMIKWLPFNSVIPSQVIIKSIENKRNIIPMPILSEDKINYLENKILEAYNTKETINIKYFYNGKIFKKSSKIKSIKTASKKVVLNDDYSINFSQILDIN